MASALSHIVYIIAVTNKHTAKLHKVGPLYILTYDARKLKHKITDYSVVQPIATTQRNKNNSKETKRK